MKLLKFIFGFLSSSVGALLILYAGYAYILESAPWHTGDYSGFVFMFKCGIPGFALLTLGILFLKQKRSLFALFGSLFLLIFVISLHRFSRVSSYLFGEIFGFAICWLLAGVGYVLVAYFLRARERD